jgi:predicted N-formylglutamate amidohydrolase
MVAFMSKTVVARGRWKLFLSCEHGGNEIPAPYDQLLTAGDRKALHTHRGWDLGALDVASCLSDDLRCPLQSATVSRLLVDLNRSEHHRACLGPSFRAQDTLLKEAILDVFYRPYRRKIEGDLQKFARRHAVLHVAVHSFTPVLNGEVRRADIGLLYDPSRRHEVLWAKRMKLALGELWPGLRIRCNYPYRGRDDGLTKAVRTLIPDRSYAGLELELNQTILEDKRQRLHVASIVGRALQVILVD